MMELLRRLKFILARRRLEREIAEEMQFHAEMAGSQQFGNLTRLTEETREVWGFGWFDRLNQDLRYTMRTFRRSPGFVSVTILSLALGIGANTAIFSLIDATLLRKLPVRAPDQLVNLRRSNLRSSGMGEFPYPFYRELRASGTPTVADLFCQARIDPSIEIHGTAERITGELVSGNYYEALGVRPWLGRLLRSDDEHAPGADGVVVLSYGYWQRRFAGDARVVGQVVKLNTIPMVIIGVAPPGFSGMYADYSPDVRVPVTMQKEMEASDRSALNDRGDWWLELVGRLKPGVTDPQVEAALSAFEHGYLNPAKPRSPNARQLFESERIQLVPAATGLSGRAKESANQLFVLMWVVGVVLLIACINVANLGLARAAARHREITVRRALGAGRRRLIRQMLTESVTLSAMGGVLGVLFALLGVRVLVSWLTAGQAGLTIDVSPDLHVLAFTAATSIFSGILFGLAPALQSTAAPLTRALNYDQRFAGLPRLFWRKAITGAQVALCVLLLIGAGLFLKSLTKLRNVDTGFDHRSMLTMTADPSLSGYNQARTRTFYREAALRVGRVPGVRAASFAQMGLIAAWGWQDGITIPGLAPKENDPGPNRNIVGPGYFSALRIPIVRGREFDAGDNAESPHVAIVNESFAKFYFGNADPLGRTIGPGEKEGPADFKIVGIAKDGKYESLRDEPHSFWYIPYEQFPRVKHLTLYARTSGDPLQLAGAIERAFRSVDPSVPVYNVKTLDEQIDEDIALDRLIATFATFFSVLAAVLAAVGLYGIVSFSVTRRTREIGIRMALGERRGSVMGLIIGEVAIVLVSAIVLAVPCAIGLGRLISSLLYGVKPVDPFAICGACALMAAATLAASYFPARRASKVDPASALRWD